MRGGGRGNFSYPGLAHFVKVDRSSVCECDKKCRQKEKKKGEEEKEVEMEEKKEEEKEYRTHSTLWCSSFPLVAWWC